MYVHLIYWCHPIPYSPTETLGIIYLRVVPLNSDDLEGALEEFSKTNDLSEVVGRKVIVRRTDHEFAV